MKGSRMEIEPSPPSDPYSIHLSYLYKALINAGRVIRRARIQPLRWDCHGGCTDGVLPSARMRCRPYVIDPNPHGPPREASKPPHSTHKGEETRGRPARNLRAEKRQRPSRYIHAPYQGPRRAFAAVRVPQFCRKPLGL